MRIVRLKNINTLNYQLCVCVQLVLELLKPDPSWGPAKREHREQFLTHVQENIGRSMEELFQSDAHLLRRLHRVVTNTSLTRSKESTSSAPPLSALSVLVPPPPGSTPLPHSHTAPGGLKALTIAQQSSIDSLADEAPELNITVRSAVSTETAPASEGRSDSAAQHEVPHSQEAHTTGAGGDHIFVLEPHAQTAGSRMEFAAKQKHGAQGSGVLGESKGLEDAVPPVEPQVSVMQFDPDVADLGTSDIVPIKHAFQFTQ